MTEISVQDLFDLFVDTLDRCRSGNLQLPDSELAYNLFEEFDVGAQSFLHEDSTEKLRDAGLINEQVCKFCEQIRTTWFALLETKVSLDEIRVSSDWAYFFRLVDKCIAEIKRYENLEV